VAISTSVPDAKIIVDGRPVGYTREGQGPLVVTLKRADEHIVTASKDGYTSNYTKIGSQLSTLGILDAVGTWIFLLPGISIITGCAMELQPPDVYVALDPKQAPVPVPVPSGPIPPAPPQPVVPESTNSPSRQPQPP
jgi:hypothetical protein